MKNANRTLNPSIKIYKTNKIPHNYNRIRQKKGGREKGFHEYIRIITHLKFF